MLGGKWRQGTTQRVLSEILVTRSNAEIQGIISTYWSVHEMTLRDHVDSEAGGDYGKFLQKLIACERDESAEPDEGLAEDQAKEVRVICGPFRRF